MWFKNLKLYRLSPNWQCNADILQSALEKQPFKPASRQEMLSMGWVAPHEGGALVHAQDGQFLICLRVEKKLLPSTVVNQVAHAREIEDQQGYKPGRKQMKDIKEQVADELLPKAFALSTTHACGSIRAMAGWAWTLQPPPSATKPWACWPRCWNPSPCCRCTSRSPPLQP